VREKDFGLFDTSSKADGNRDASYQKWMRNRDGRRPSLTKVLHRGEDVLLWEA
jgi:hypothetical protein